MSKNYIGSTGLQHVLNLIKNVVDTKVDKVEGKGLSANDYDATAVAEVAKIANKVDKVEGKGLSTVDFTDTAYVHTDNNYDAAAVAEVAKVADKVDKVEGKGLSTVDFTDTSYVHTDNNYDAAAVAEVAKVADKVDKVEGKGLSTVDFTDTSYVHTDNNYDANAVAEVAKVANKVDKVDGKGLSTNDLTDALKTQYDAAQANVIESVKVDGTALTITDKAVNITLPTVDAEMSDSSTNAVQNKVIKKYIDDELDSITGVEYQTADTVEELPETGAKGTIYLVPNSGSGKNVFDEYIWASNAYEKIGTTETDLTGYVKETDITEISTSELNTLFNGVFRTNYTTT